MSTEKDEKTTVLEAIDQCAVDAAADMEANRAAGKPVRGMGVVTVPIPPGETPDPTIAYDARVAALRKLIVEGKVKLVALVTVEGEADGSLGGRTEILTNSHSFDPALVVWSVNNDLPALLANNLYDSVARVVEEYARAIMQHAAKHVERREKAGDN